MWVPFTETFVCNQPSPTLTAKTSRHRQQDGTWCQPIWWQEKPETSWKLGQNPHIWVNYNDLTATTGIMVSKGNHPQMALIQAQWNIIIYHNIPRHMTYHHQLFAAEEYVPIGQQIRIKHGVRWSPFRRFSQRNLHFQHRDITIISCRWLHLYSPLFHDTSVKNKKCRGMSRWLTEGLPGRSAGPTARDGSAQCGAALRPVDVCWNSMGNLPSGYD